MDRNRDDAAINEMLSQLSHDENVLEEVRKIVSRGLKAPCAYDDNQQTQGPQEQEHSKLGDTSEQPSSSNEKSFRNPRKEKVTPQSTTSENDEELAFTVDKESDTYRNIYSTVQWYRDSFLMGSTFADQRSAVRKVIHSGNNVKLRESGKKTVMGNQITNQGVLPKSDPPTALGHPLLLSAAESYIRSISAIDLLRPYVTWIVSRDGPMIATATQSLAQSIPLAQSSSDWAMRENLLWVLKDEEWKDFAKSITTTYVDRSYRDD
mmetsp:Transcript_37682/g.80490  ORF Transcript_37682/g.80490 Transcript_37682/m.80490 type:complete len:264 (-) Transcript_37682:389-1180(-)